MRVSQGSRRAGPGAAMRRRASEPRRARTRHPGVPARTPAPSPRRLRPAAAQAPGSRGIGRISASPPPAPPPALAAAARPSAPRRHPHTAAERFALQVRPAYERATRSALPVLMSALVAPSPDADNRKRRFQSSGECEEALPKRRYAEARRLLDWVAHLCQRYPLMSDKVRVCAAKHHACAPRPSSGPRARYLPGPSAAFALTLGAPTAGNHARAGLVRGRRRGCHPPPGRALAVGGGARRRGRGGRRGAGGWRAG